MPDANPTLWVLTDGKAGDEQPLIGVAEAMGVVPQLRHVHPRAPWSWLMPLGPIDPREGTARTNSPIAPPFPDICLATGRRAVAYLRTVKRLSPRTYAVVFKDPRTTRHGADLVVVQEHDQMRGANVLVAVTAPNRISLARLTELRSAPPASLLRLKAPRLAVLVGGNSRHHQFTEADCARLLNALEEEIVRGRSLMITASRRTPDNLRQALAELGQRPQVQFWTGEGDNPLLAYLALADEVIVTSDSSNMVGEAASTGRPLQVFHPSGGHRKFERFIEALAEVAVVGRYPDAPAAGAYPPVNSTDQIAKAILEGWRSLATS